MTFRAAWFGGSALTRVPVDGGCTVRASEGALSGSLPDSLPVKLVPFMAPKPDCRSGGCGSLPVIAPEPSAGTASAATALVVESAERATGVAG